MQPLMAVFLVTVGLVRLVVSTADGLSHRAWIALRGLIALVFGLLVCGPLVRRRR